MERLVFYYNDMNCKIDQQIVELGDLSETSHMFSLGAKRELLLFAYENAKRIASCKKRI